MHRLAEEKGLGVVAALHEVNMAARFCDEIIARGTPDAIMTPQELMAIYSIPWG